MVVMIIPECTKCKTSKKVVFNHTWTDNDVGFFIAYCEKCYTVMECSFSMRVLHKEEVKNEKDKQKKKSRNKSTKRI